MNATATTALTAPTAPILVTGASGQLGKLVLEKLLAKGEGPIIATTRKPESLKAFAERGIDVRKASFDDEASTLAKAFAGASRMLLISTDSLEGPGSRAKQHIRAIEAAKLAGIKHIVYTSLIDAKTSTIGLALDHKMTEEALEKSGIGFTVLRNNFYTELLLGTLLPALASGSLLSAALEGKIAYVTRDDCAAAAVGALVSFFEGRRFLDVTGPAGLSATDVAKVATEVLGKKVAYTAVSVGQLVEGMVKAGAPQPMAEFFAGIDVSVAGGALQTTGSGVKDLTGKAPTSVSEFLAAHRAALAPSV